MGFTDYIIDSSTQEPFVGKYILDHYASSGSIQYKSTLLSVERFPL